MKIKKLNIGCGIYKKNGYTNLDFRPEVKPDVLHDLNKYPYPFSDKSYDIIEAHHVLEHLYEPFMAMHEFHRILKNNGILKITVPHCSRGFSHPEHKSGFDVTFPFYFDKKYPAYFRGDEFKLNKIQLHWLGQPYLRKSHLPPFTFYSLMFLNKIFNFLANLNRFFCAKFWCYWVGGFDEIEFEFACKKNGNSHT